MEKGRERKRERGERGCERERESMSATIMFRKKKQ